MAGKDAVPAVERSGCRRVGQSTREDARRARSEGMLSRSMLGSFFVLWSPRRRSFWTATQTQTTSRTTELHNLDLVTAVTLEVLAFSVRFKNCKVVTVCCKGRMPSELNIT